MLCLMLISQHSFSAHLSGYDDYQQYNGYSFKAKTYTFSELTYLVTPTGFVLVLDQPSRNWTYATFVMIYDDANLIASGVPYAHPEPSPYGLFANTLTNFDIGNINDILSN